MFGVALRVLCRHLYWLIYCRSVSVVSETCETDDWNKKWPPVWTDAWDCWTRQIVCPAPDKGLLQEILYVVKISWLFFTLTTQRSTNPCGVWLLLGTEHFRVISGWNFVCKRSLYQLQVPGSFAQPIFWICCKRGQARQWISPSGINKVL